MYVLAVLFSAILILLPWCWIRKYNYWKRKGIPYLIGKFPFGTNRELTLYLKSVSEVTQEIYRKLVPNPYGGVFIWFQPFLFIRDPEIIQTIITKDFSYFRDRGRISAVSKYPLTKNLFNLDGDLWKLMRLKLTPTFTSGRLKNMFNLFEVCAIELENELKKFVNNDKAVNIKHLSSGFTQNIILSCCFGLKPNASKNNDFFNTWQGLFPSDTDIISQIKFSLATIFPDSFLVKNIRFLGKKIETLFMALVTNIVKYREENNITRNDFVDLLIRLKNKGHLENENIDITETTSFAGFETSSSVLTFTLYELALNQDIQNKLRTQLDIITEKYGGKITYEAFNEMYYLEQVISESLRKYPSLPVLQRRCSKPYRLPDNPDVIIERGTKIIIPIHAIQNDPKYFTNPDKFDPDRFSPENKSSIIPFSYLPFGEGPRYCVGKKMGILQTKMGLYTILKKYKVLTTKETQIPLEFGVNATVTTLKRPLLLMIQPRDDLTPNKDSW